MHSDDFDRSRELELEVGDDLAAYKLTDEELEELLDDILLGEKCENCAAALDENGLCRICDFDDDDVVETDNRSYSDILRDGMDE